MVTGSPSLKNRVVGTLGSTAVSVFSVSQLVACVKFIPPTSLLGLGIQALSIAGVYVGARWSIEQLLETHPELTKRAPKEVILPEVVVAPVATSAPALTPAPVATLAPVLTPARIMQASGRKTRGFTKHMLDAILETDPVLIDEKDRAPIKTINHQAISLEPINAYKSDDIYITSCNHGLVINEFARHLISRSRFENPYNRELLKRADIQNLLQHKVIQDTVSLYRIPVKSIPLLTSKR